MPEPLPFTPYRCVIRTDGTVERLAAAGVDLAEYSCFLESVYGSSL